MGDNSVREQPRPEFAALLVEKKPATNKCMQGISVSQLAILLLSFFQRLPEKCSRPQTSLSSFKILCTVHEFFLLAEKFSITLLMYIRLASYPCLFHQIQKIVANCGDFRTAPRRDGFQSLGISQRAPRSPGGTGCSRWWAGRGWSRETPAAGRSGSGSGKRLQARGGGGNEQNVIMQVTN